VQAVVAATAPRQLLFGFDPSAASFENDTLYFHEVNTVILALE